MRQNTFGTASAELASIVITLARAESSVFQPLLGWLCFVRSSSNGCQPSTPGLSCTVTYNNIPKKKKNPPLTYHHSNVNFDESSYLVKLKHLACSDGLLVNQVRN